MISNPDFSLLKSRNSVLNVIKETLQKDFKVATVWFFENYMSLNPTKCHYMCHGKNKENDKFNFGKIVKKK